MNVRHFKDGFKYDETGAKQFENAEHIYASLVIRKTIAKSGLSFYKYIEYILIL